MSNRLDGGANPPSTGEPETRRPGRIRPLIAASVVLAPLLWLITSIGIALVSAVADPASTCWSKVSDTQWIFASDLALAVLLSSLEYWGPIVLLAFFMFGFFEWLRLRAIAMILATYALGFYVLAFDTGWIERIIERQYQVGCA